MNPANRDQHRPPVGEIKSGARPLVRFTRRLGLMLGLAVGPILAAAGDGAPLQFDRLDLNDGRQLKNVVVRSYDARTERLLVVADGKAMMVPLALVPAPYNQQLRSAPASGGSVSSVPEAPAQPGATSASSQPVPTGPAGKQRPAADTAQNPGKRRAKSSTSGSLSKEASLAQHQAAARARATKYFRYEFQIGSNSISVTALDFELGPTAPVPGWTGRCRTEGKAFIEYFDSKGRSFQRTTSIFEVTTEQKPGEALTVIDFTRKG